MKISSSSGQDRFHPGKQPWDPGYFDLVMATGIVSLAAFVLNYTWIAYGLFLFNIVATIILSLLLAGKIIFSFDQIKYDFRHHRRGPAYFTLVASTNILGSQFYLILAQHKIAAAMWCLGLALNILITYSFFTTTTITSDKPGIGKGINGTWLISVVATQSTPVLGALVVHICPDNMQHNIVFLSLVFFYAGCMLYMILITLIFYRLIFLPLRASELGAPYWINMGAVAITTLAGFLLLMSMKGGPLAELVPFTKGITLFFWSFATWWIPLLLILGFWRHFRNKIDLPWTNRGYDLSYWSMVFPLGMYTLCTYDMARILPFSFLVDLSKYFIYVAFVAWLLTFIGMSNHIIRKISLKYIKNPFN